MHEVPDLGRVKGMVYGVTNIVPGIGGGIMLILLGIYEQFVDALGNLLIKRDRWKEYLSFLVPVAWVLPLEWYAGQVGDVPVR
jgi:uncharacterized membrane protein